MMSNGMTLAPCGEQGSHGRGKVTWAGGTWDSWGISTVTHQWLNYRCLGGAAEADNDVNQPGALCRYVMYHRPSVPPGSQVNQPGAPPTRKVKGPPLQGVTQGATSDDTQQDTLPTLAHLHIDRHSVDAEVEALPCTNKRRRGSRAAVSSRSSPLQTKGQRDQAAKYSSVVLSPIPTAPSSHCSHLPPCLQPPPSNPHTPGREALGAPLS